MRERQQRAQSSRGATAAQRRHRRERAFAQEEAQAQLSKATARTEGVKLHEITANYTGGSDRVQGLAPLSAVRLSQGCQEVKAQGESHHGERGSAQHGENTQRDSPRWKLPLKVAARVFRAQFEPPFTLYIEVYSWTAVPRGALSVLGCFRYPRCIRTSLWKCLSPATLAAQHLFDY